MVEAGGRNELLISHFINYSGSFPSCRSGDVYAGLSPRTHILES